MSDNNFNWKCSENNFTKESSFQTDNTTNYRDVEKIMRLLEASEKELHKIFQDFYL